MRVIALFIMLLIPAICITCKSQNRQLDSLLAKNVSYHKEDTIKARLLNNISHAYKSVNPSNSIDMAEAALVLSNKIGYRKGIAVALSNKGAAYSRLFNLGKADSVLKEALAIHLALKDTAGITANWQSLGYNCYLQGNPEDALAYYEKGLLVAYKTNNKSLEARFNTGMGMCYHLKGDAQNSLLYFTKAYNYHITTKDPENIAANLCNLGNVYAMKAEWDRALAHYNQALRINDSLSWKVQSALVLGNIALVYTNMAKYTEAAAAVIRTMVINKSLKKEGDYANGLNTLGMIYSQMEEREKAITVFEQALHIYDSLKGIKGRATVLGNLSIMYKETNQYEKAIIYGKEALAINVKLKLESDAALQTSNLGAIYSEIDDATYEKLNGKNTVRTEEALKLLLTGLAMKEKEGYKNEKIADFLAIGNLYVRTGEVKRGITYLVKAKDLATEIGDKHSESASYEYLGNAYEKNAQFDSAYYFTKNFFLLRDSINNNEKKKEITRLELKYEFDRKEGEYILKQQLSNEHLKRQAQLLQLKQADLSIAQKEKELQHLAYLKTQAELDGKKEQLTRKEKDIKLIAFEKKHKEQQALNTLQAERSKTTITLLVASLFVIVFATIAALIIYTNKLRQLKSTQAMRNAISSNLHDDVGSGLSSITILGSMLRNVMKNNPEKALELAEKINETSSEMMDNMRDIVWSINSGINRSDDSLITRMRNFGAVMFENKGIEFSFNDYTANGIDIPDENKHHYYLIYKEAINNAVKYSGTKSAIVELTERNGGVTLMIKDEGAGFDLAERNNKGNGLSNMKNRAMKIGATLNIESKPGNGTTITLTVQV